MGALLLRQPKESLQLLIPIRHVLSAEASEAELGGPPSESASPDCVTFLSRPSSSVANTYRGLEKGAGKVSRMAALKLLQSSLVCLQDILVFLVWESVSWSFLWPCVTVSRCRQDGRMKAFLGAIGKP